VNAQNQPGSPAQTTQAEIVTVHSFSVGGADYEQFVLDLTAMVEGLYDQIEGMRQVAVLREHGTGKVAVLAEWESRAAQVQGIAVLYRDEALGQVTRRSSGGDSHAYEVVARHAQTPS
jgi:heme-degrading monooxygenase HmoA